MSSIQGKVGPWQLEWLSPPRGPKGSARLRIENGERIEVSWEKDAHGIWIRLPSGVKGFDVRRIPSDEGADDYELIERVGPLQWKGMGFLRAGEEEAVAGAASQKKDVKVKSQMPGKIVQVQVEPGQKVQKEDPLLVMEAMKMENVMIAPSDGVVKKINVEAGQPVESGAVLVVLGPEEE